MAKTEDLTTSLTGNSAVSRRGFLQGTAAAGAVSALYGCSRSDSDTEYIVVDNGGSGSGDSEDIETTVVYGSSTHNCGGKCLSRAVVSNGRIIRILSDEAIVSGDGTYLDPESRNKPQHRVCTKCRAYRYRIYHPGRLKYPLKQTKKRGQLDGFQRISWAQAYAEIAHKHNNVYEKYGLDGIYVLYASAANHGIQGRDTLDMAYRYMGRINKLYFGSYSTHQNTYFGTGYTGMNQNLSANFIANHTKTLLLWGDNSMTTRNNQTYSALKVAEDMKKRDPQSEVIYIGPHFSDGGIVVADEWIVSKPFTDPALVAGMLYHLLEKTFNLETGQQISSEWLDVDYLDTMVYGFFDSPAYTLDDATGNIDASVSQPAGRKVASVPAGRSYCSWILGNNNNAPAYDTTTTNYTAMQYAAGQPGFKRWAPCNYTNSGNTSTPYETKKDFRTAKTPAWASKITGIPETTIRALAEKLIKNGPVTSVWSGGQQKQADGIANLYALQALQIITKNVSQYGSGYGNTYGPSQIASTGNLPAITIADTAKNVPKNHQKPNASCTAWHTTIKAAFANELITNGYRANHIPNWEAAVKGTLKTGDGDIYWDDGGSKAASVVWRRDSDGNVVTYRELDSSNNVVGEYFDWEGRSLPAGTDAVGDAAHAGSPIYAGIRLMYNNAGNIFINQHENSNDSREMLEYLNLNDHTDPDSFCLVTFDNFLAPTARWSDYILPTSTAWEHDTFITPNGASAFFMPQVSTPPGESKQSWDIAVELINAYEKIGGKEVTPNGHLLITGQTSGTAPLSVEQHAREAYYKYELEYDDGDNSIKVKSAGPYHNPSSPFYGKSWEEYLKNPYLPPKHNDLAVSTPTHYQTMQNYKALTAAEKTQPFIKNVNNYYITTNSYNSSGAGYGNEYANTDGAPVPSLRYQVYSPLLTWQYRNRFSKWHGHLKSDNRGQPHTDLDGDPLVLEIPVYYAYQDYFMEAYGNNPRKLDDLQFLMTTTHNRYRSHSSMAENPLLRELSHRVPGRDEKGEFKYGNDYGYYAMGPDQEFGMHNTGGSYPELASAINPDGSVDEDKKEIASYSEIWINKTDAEQIIGIEDGDLVRVENPVGAVYCVARVTTRCARGYVDLHQGCWYDPRPLPNFYGHDYVDVGGNANTLMASQPSRIDHGNGQQTAMVKIVKVNY